MSDTPSTPPLNGERLVSFAAAARAAGVPGARGGAHPNASTLFRWATKGAPAADGTKHRLEAVRVGGHWYTSVAAVHRLVSRLTDASTPSDTSAATSAPTPARRARAARDASAEVEAMLATA